MWKYTELDAYDSITLHDCRASHIEIDGCDLIFHFPNGFGITPVSIHNDFDRTIYTGPAQLRFHGCIENDPFITIDVYKTTYFFGKPLICRRIQPKFRDFLRIINKVNYELEFITEYHSSIFSLYQCWIWKKNSGMYAECQFEIFARSIEYCWNEMLLDGE